MEISKQKTALFSSLKSKKMRDRHSMFVVEGEKSVSDTLGSFPLVNLIATPGWLDNNKDIWLQYGDRTLSADINTLKKISSLSSVPEVIAVFRISGHKEIPDLRDRLVIVLDGVQDPGNLGTIIRTADWFGVYDIIASPDTASIYNPKTIQATMGSLKRVNVHYTDLRYIFEEYPDKKRYGLILGAQCISDVVLSNDAFIIMGNEGNGISLQIRELIDNPVMIPPFNPSSHPDSLNVSIATAVTLTLFRKL